MPTVYITIPRADADELAGELVEAGLAACVNRVECRSTYRWEGELQEDAEAILLAKTTDDRYDELCAHVRETHPYEVPCIERFETTDVFGPFADWMREATRA